VRCALLLPTLLALAACDSPPGPDVAPNVVLISVDTLRADHLGCYGHAAPTSPFLDSLAAEGVRFEQVFATASWTLPSHMSLLTSLHPHAHRVETERAGLAPDVVTLAQVLKRAGYETTGFVSWVFVSRKYGFDRGFDRFVELLPAPERRRPGSPDTIQADAFVDQVLEWATFADARPYFLFLHLFDPHLDYAPPLAYAQLFDPQLRDASAGRYSALRPYIRGLGRASRRVPPAWRDRAAALYAGEIRFVDTELARLFEGLRRRGLLEDTLVVFTSDHGEELDDHGSMEGHGWTLYDEVIRVPLLLRLSGAERAGTVVRDVVSSIDVAPTILDAVGVPAPRSFAGRSLLPLVRGESVPPARAFSQIRRFNEKWSLRTSRYKLVYTSDTGTNAFGVPVEAGFELYDLEEDPREETDVYDSARAAGELTDLLRDFMGQRVEEPAPPAGPLSVEERRRLRSLGYLQEPSGTAGAGSRQSAPGPPR
jgi:arylsulfatase A-like enzyme